MGAASDAWVHPAALNPIQGEGRRVGAGEEVANHQRQDLYLTWRSGSSQQCRYLCCCCYSTAAASSSWWNGPSPISTPGWPTKSREELSGLIPLLTWTNTFLHNCRRTNRVWRVDGNVNAWTEERGEIKIWWERDAVGAYFRGWVILCCLSNTENWPVTYQIIRLKPFTWACCRSHCLASSLKKSCVWDFAISREYKGMRKRVNVWLRGKLRF